MSIMDDPYAKLVTKELLEALKTIADFLNVHHFVAVHINHVGTARFGVASPDEDDMVLTPVTQDMMRLAMGWADEVHRHVEALP